MKRYIKSSDDVRTYQNRRNPNKFIETKKYDDGHSVARQYMEWDTPTGTVRNYSGSKSNRGRWHRAGQHTRDMMLEDYDEVMSAQDIEGLIPYVVKVGYDAGGPEDGPIWRSWDQVVYAENEEDAERRVYENDPDIEGCSVVREATQEDIEQLYDPWEAGDPGWPDEKPDWNEYDHEYYEDDPDIPFR